MGNPSLYKTEYDEQVFKLCLLGAIDTELASFFNVDVATINNWKIAHPSFFESIKKGKINADADAAHSLFRRVKGFEYDETTYEAVVVDGKKGKTIKLPLYKKKVVTKFMPPDVGACFIWLKNRRPDDWRDKKEVSGSFNDGGSAEDLKKEIALLMAENGFHDSGPTPVNPS